jgi:hypothetical protein
VADAASEDVAELPAELSEDGSSEDGYVPMSEWIEDFDARTGRPRD